MRVIGLQRALRVALLVALAAFVAAGVAARDHGYRISPVLSASMVPAFGPGDVLVTELVPASRLRPGMVPVIVPPGETMPYAHRITTVQGPPDRPILTTKGDANPVPDTWHAQLATGEVPVVVRTVPEVGRVLLWMRGERYRSFGLLLVGLVATVAGLRLCTASRPRP